jgi:hypothetical protein
MSNEMCIVCGKHEVSDQETGHCEEYRKLDFLDECKAHNERFMREEGWI